MRPEVELQAAVGRVFFDNDRKVGQDGRGLR